MSITIRSAAKEHGSEFKVSVDGQEVKVEGGERGIGLVVLEKGTRKVVEARIYDTHLDPNESALLNKAIYQVKQGNMIIMGVKDEGSRSLSLDLIQTLTALGSKQIQSLGLGDSWAFLVRKGKPQTAKEAKEAHGPAEIKARKKPLLRHIAVKSAAYYHGNEFTLTVNESPSSAVTYAASAQRGIVLVVLDNEGKVRMNQIFDTHQSSEAADQLEATIQSVASQYPGNLIVLGVKDDGSQALTESLRAVIGGLGSKLIGQLGYRDSWCFIGRLGKPSSARECLDSSASASLSWLPKRQRSPPPLPYSLQFLPPNPVHPPHPHPLHPHQPASLLSEPPVHSVHHRGSVGPGVGVGVGVNISNRARRRDTLG